MTWWWASVCDLDKPAGKQLVGVSILSDLQQEPPWWGAIAGPGIEVAIYEIPADLGDPPDEWADQLLTDKARIRELTQAWHGCDCVTVGEWERLS